MVFLGCSNDPVKVEKEQEDNRWQWDTFPAQWRDSVDGFFQEQVQIMGFSGCYLIRDSNRVYEGVLGKAAFRTNDSMTVEHTFQLGSVSKTITGVAVMQLIARGLISVEDSVSQYIEGFPYHGITIGMLLSHRSGVGNYMYVTDSLWYDLSVMMSNDDVLSLLEQHVPMTYYQPDEKFNYCNTNYMLLASIVECASGYTFDRYVKEYIFDVAGMHSARIFRGDNTPELVKPAIGHNAYHQPKVPSYLDGVVGDKGVYAGIHDLLAFDMALRNGILLSDSIQDVAYTPRSKQRLLKSNYGYGWRIRDDLLNRKVVFHNGWWRGFKCYFIRLPEEDRMITVLTNCTRGGFLDQDELLHLFEILDAI